MNYPDLALASGYGRVRDLDSIVEKFKKDGESVRAWRGITKDDLRAASGAYGRLKAQRRFKETPDGRRLMPTEATLHEVKMADFSYLVSYAETQPDAFTLWGWSYLLAHGKVYDYYGSDAYGRSYSLLHIFRCGVDGDNSSAPTLDTWEEFAGTRAGSDKNSGFMAENIHCRCGMIDDITLVVDVESNFSNGIPGMLQEAFEAGQRRAQKWLAPTAS